MTTAPRPTIKTAVLDPDASVDLPASARLLLPAGVLPYQLNWPYILAIGAYHGLALLAFMPGYFSWSGLIVAMLGTHLCGLFGINLCYHRLLTHRGLKCPKWLEHAMVVIAMSCLQETPARWVAIHRRHHQFADQQPDPHSPLASFFWAHIGWILVHQPELSRLGIYERYAKDILRDRFYVALERHDWLVWINLIQMPLFFAAGFAVAWLFGATPAEAAQVGLSILLFGVFVRTVLVWHITWAVNSVTHVWGYRNYETDEDSRNNIDRRPDLERRRLAQQPPRRPALGAPRPSLVGDGQHLAHHSLFGVDGIGERCRRTEHASRKAARRQQVEHAWLDRCPG